MNLDEIRERAENLKSEYHNRHSDVERAADTILQLVAEVELLQTGLGVAGEFIDRNDKLIAANKILRQHRFKSMHFPSIGTNDEAFEIANRIMDEVIAEADEVLK